MPDGRKDASTQRPTKANLKTRNKIIDGLNFWNESYWLRWILCRRCRQTLSIVQPSMTFFGEWWKLEASCMMCRRLISFFTTKTKLMVYLTDLLSERSAHVTDTRFPLLEKSINITNPKICLPVHDRTILPYLRPTNKSYYRLPKVYTEPIPKVNASCRRPDLL